MAARVRTCWAAVARGRGVATAAARAVARWAFDDVGLHLLEPRHSVQNEASCRVAKKADFPWGGTARSALLHPDGWHDVHLHGPVADDS